MHEQGLHAEPALPYVLFKKVFTAPAGAMIGQLVLGALESPLPMWCMR
jgi:hypothetical protein